MTREKIVVEIQANLKKASTLLKRKNVLQKKEVLQEAEQLVADSFDLFHLMNLEG